METITIQNLTFTYPNRSTAAISNINLSIEPGEFVTLCGPSGGGKSTLLRQLKPLLSPHGERQGQVLFGTRDVTSLSQREQAENIGFVMQNPDNQIVCDKVWHELAFGLENLGCPQEEIRAKVAEMASFFGIATWYEKDIAQLSGGQKQLLNLAAVMVMQPSILILDEPTAQLDPIAAHDFLDTVVKINRELGTTVLLSEHRLEEALPLSDKVIVLEKGKVTAQGDLQTVGNILKGQKSPMLLALPTPMRVYFAKPDESPCPLNVREGRLWLSKQSLTEISYPKKESPHGSPLLSAEKLWFRYEKTAPDVLKGASLSLYPGQCYALLGGNGTGKSTLLSALMGINRTYSGKVKIQEGKKLAALPQNPQDLFLKKTVALELGDLQSEKVQTLVDFCELTSLLDSHPYDLSGGEQQRLALAKVLLHEPDILLLDEPTKGLDARFKQKLAALLSELKNQGMAIFMVSHDVEFCAEYADQMGLFFEGHIVSEEEPRAFFSGKSFHTTAANRMARHRLPQAFLPSDIIRALGGEPEQIKVETPAALQKFERPNVPKPSKKSKKYSPTSIVLGILFALCFFAVQTSIDENDFSVKAYLLQAVAILSAGLSLYNLLPQKVICSFSVPAPKTGQRLSVRTLLAAAMILLLIPLTILWGMTSLEDRRYYFISLLIILETFLPFLLIFEGRKPKARELVIISVLCALCVAGRLAFAPLPQFKPVLALVIIAGISFGGETGFLVGAVTAFVSNMYFTQGPWTPWQMFSFGIIGFLAGVLFQKGLLRKTRLSLSLFGFVAAVVIFGGIMNPASVILYYDSITWELILGSFALGLPSDLVHGVSTAFFLWFLAEPLCEKFHRTKEKYGM